MFARSQFHMIRARETVDTRMEVVEISIGLRPVGKERARLNWSTPKKTREFEDLVGKVSAAQMGGRPAITFPVAAHVIFGLHGNKADADNLEKALWDGLQKGDASGRNKVLADDKLVRGCIEKTECEVPRGEEFIWLRLYARRREDYTNYMEQCNAIDDLPESDF